MTLEDFERSLAANRREDAESGKSREHREKDKDHRQSHRHHHRPSKSGKDDDEDRSRHRRKRRRRSVDLEDAEGAAKRREKEESSSRQAELRSGPTNKPEEKASNCVPNAKEEYAVTTLRRDAWMQDSAIDIDYVQRSSKKASESAMARSSKPDFDLRVHDKELNPHLRDLANGKSVEETAETSAQQEVDYTFGDAGSKWRMTRLKAVYDQAEAAGTSVEEIALERYGDLRTFDEAREERAEMDRRETYGKGYLGSEKPTGNLYNERIESFQRQQDKDTENQPSKGQFFDQAALRRLKVQLDEAKLKDSPHVAKLETEYAAALETSANQPSMVVLGAQDTRMLAGSRKGEVKAVDTRRGRERGLVEENEDMTIEDMVKEERRTRGQFGGEGRRFAERIAKDGAFADNLDYMDENASRLAKRVQKSDNNLKNVSINEYQKMNRILDKCPLCHHEDTNTPPTAPVVSLATRVYLSLPTEPEISKGGAFIVPIQHRTNLIECDDDEWEEIRNFMKSLTRMYADHGRSVIFYENAAQPERRKHAAMEVVPLPESAGDTAPAFFKEAILSSDEEWSQHVKIIDTISLARSRGLGKSAFRRSIAKEMPYFHVWFHLDGGLGHIVEDAQRWPRGDLFAREIIGGMLDVEPGVIKRQGRWKRGEEMDRRVDRFRKGWQKWDWTSILTDA